MDFDTYIRMGGYAFHVWGAYGLAILGYGGMMVYALVQYDRLRRKETASG